jgi:two-component system CheB/CheR fusion protein
MKGTQEPLGVIDTLPAEQLVNILLVDDRYENLLALSAVLSDLGANLVPVTSGEEGLRRLLNEDFAVVLLDVQMQGLDGFETARLIRGREKTRHTPIVFLTAYDTNRLPIEEAYALGAVDYLIKPLVPVILRAKVTGFIELFLKTEQVKWQAEKIRQMDRKEFELKLAEENARFREQREWFRVTLSSIGDAVISTDTAGQIISLNAVAQSLTGWSPEEAKGRPLDEVCKLVHERTQAPIANLVGNVIAQRSVVGHLRDTVLVSRCRTHRPVEASAAPIRDADGTILGMVLVIRDVTERRRAETAIQESEQRFARFMQHLPGLAWIKDLGGRYVYANEAAEQAFGRPRADLYGRTDEEVFPPATAARFKENDAQALADGRGVQVVETLQHSDGAVHHSLVSKFPIPGPDGRPAWVGGMAIDITDRLRAEEALRESDRRKDEFLAMLAHELRNPLAPLRNALQIMKMPGVDDATLRHARDMMERQLQQMVRLVDDLLDVSRMMRDKIELRKQRVELATVITRAVETARPLIDSHHHALTVSLPSEPVWLDADLIRLAQVVSNLLFNAAKYTEDGGRISVSAARDGEEVVVRVKDTGIGIDAEMLPRLFRLFVQADRSLARAHGGMGIGLALVRKLVELHGGRVEVQSDGPDRGSEFTVRLPATARSARGGDGVVREEEPLPLAAGAPLRVLVVDDNRDTAESLALLLRAEGHSVRVAHDAPTALQLAQSVRPDIAFLDIGMPVMDGYELSRRLRAQPALNGLLLVAVTGWGQDEDRRRSREAGFDRHLVKPVEPASLHRLLGGECT